jgi:hypothetical protein
MSMTLSDWGNLITDAAIIFYARQQNQIFRQQNQIFANPGQQADPRTGPHFSWIGRYWPTLVMIALMIVPGYDIYDRHMHGPATDAVPVPWRYGAFLLLIAVSVGLAIGRRAKAQAPASAPPIEDPNGQSKLVIHWANYRAWQEGGETYDVAEFLRKKISGDSLVFVIENKNFVIDNQNFVPEDPLWGKPKRLKLSYSYNGEPARTIERPEPSRLVLPEDSEIQRLGEEMKRVEQTSPIKISMISEHVEYNGTSDCPLKLRFHLRNDSPYPLDIQYQDYRPELITLKKSVTEIFQIRMAGAWLPTPNGLGQVAVLPTQQFAGWIAADESRFNKGLVEEHRGKIGTLVLLVNGRNVEIKL